MAQIDFFLCEEERLDLIKFAFQQRYRIVPDKHYGSGEYKVAETLEDYSSFAKDSALLFLLHDSYTVYPLVMDFIEKEGGRRYYIKQRYGGPTIDVYSPVFGERENRTIGSGFIGIYPFYYAEAGGKLTPDPALKVQYEQWKTVVRKMGVRIKMGSRSYYVGRRSIEKVRRGELKFVESTFDILQLALDAVGV